MPKQDSSPSPSDSNDAARPTIDEICLSNPVTEVNTHPSVPAIYPAAVYQCESTQDADQILGGTVPGFAYQRDAHPNAARLAEKCRQMHSACGAAITSSGMAALSAIVLGNLKSGDHILVSDQMYGRSSVLLEQQLPGLGIECETFDPTQLDQVEKRYQAGKTKMVFAETISNPLIRLVDIPRLVRMGRELNFQVAIDNTFATPFLCRPLDLGVDWVWESYSKMLNGHSDVMMGLVCGRDPELWPMVAKAISTWGLSSAPFECYLAERGLTTFGLRIRASIENARNACRLFEGHPALQAVHYAGKTDHCDRDKIQQMLQTESLDPAADVLAAGNVISIQLKGGAPIDAIHSEAVSRFLHASQIPYYPSLGECNTTISHPCSSSHRHMSGAERNRLGISADTIRICCGIEPWSVLERKLNMGLES